MTELLQLLSTTFMTGGQGVLWFRESQEQALPKVTTADSSDDSAGATPIDGRDTNDAHGRGQCSREQL